MRVLQAWLVVGIPMIVLAVVMFIGRSPWRALLGYVFLGVGFAVVTSVDRTSGALFAGVLALLYASGRGGRLEAEGAAATDTDRQADRGPDRGFGADAR